jgi:hypothetical protein
MGLAPEGTQAGDILVVLLGCSSPMILRPTAENRFLVIGEAFSCDLENGEALLGPLPDHIDPVWRWIEAYAWLSFKIRETGEFLDEDPRLGPLPSGWECEANSPTDPRLVYWNDESGVEPTFAHPDLTPQGLRKRGVPLGIFELV